MSLVPEPAGSATAHLVSTLERFLRHHTSSTSQNRLLVAFSGGPDSTALLWGLHRLASASAAPSLTLLAAHIDHGLDSDSGRRAHAARELAACLGVPFLLATPSPSDRPGTGLGPEAAARQLRYHQLSALADAHEASFILTAHHADDQAETVLLRLLFGSGLRGMAAIQPQHGRLLRPLLSMGRQALATALTESGLRALDDPTNRDLTVPRNRIRHLLLPRLAVHTPTISADLARLATAARQANDAIADRLAGHLRLQQQAEGATVDRARLERLPNALLPHALALLHRSAGVPYPAPTTARRELQRQLARGGRIGCDCGAAWRWEGDGRTFRLVRLQPEAADFTYTLKVPGEMDIPSLGARLRIIRRPVASWMYRHHPRRAGFAASLEAGSTVTVRNRRRGDRFQPFGRRKPIRLKDLFIDRRVPRAERARLPLLVIDGDIAWVPGVSLGEPYRIRGEQWVWVAELLDPRPAEIQARERRAKR